MAKAGSAALAGGINMMLLGSTTAMFQRAGMLAPDGRCKALDAAADGYVRAEGCAMLLLAAAGAAQQPLALLAGSAVNQDGRASSLTAPNGPSQQQVIRAALASGGLDAGDVRSLQMHGTGTALGDPIEVGAALPVLLGAKAGAGSAARPPVMLLGNKTLTGHAEPAAGAMGALFAVHQLAQQAAVPLLHLRTPNPHVTGERRGARALGLLPLLLRSQTTVADAAAENARSNPAQPCHTRIPSMQASWRAYSCRAAGPRRACPRPCTPAARRRSAASAPSPSRAPTRTWCWRQPPAQLLLPWALPPPPLPPRPGSAGAPGCTRGPASC